MNSTLRMRNCLIDKKNKQLVNGRFKESKTQQDYLFHQHIHITIFFFFFNKQGNEKRKRARKRNQWDLSGCRSRWMTRQYGNVIIVEQSESGPISHMDRVRINLYFYKIFQLANFHQQEGRSSAMIRVMCQLRVIRYWLLMARISTWESPSKMKLGVQTERGRQLLKGPPKLRRCWGRWLDNALIMVPDESSQLDSCLQREAISKAVSKFTLNTLV